MSSRSGAAWLAAWTRVSLDRAAAMANVAGGNLAALRGLGTPGATHRGPQRQPAVDRGMRGRRAVLSGLARPRVARDGERSRGSDRHRVHREDDELLRRAKGEPSLPKYDSGVFWVGRVDGLAVLVDAEREQATSLFSPKTSASTRHLPTGRGVPRRRRWRGCGSPAASLRWHLGQATVAVDMMCPRCGG